MVAGIACHAGGQKCAGVNSDGVIKADDDVLETRTHYPFGMFAFGTKAAGHESDRRDFTGHELVGETSNPTSRYQSVLNMKARYYIPGLALFASPDALADEPEQVFRSPYAYAWNDPTNLTDPDGNCPWCATALIGGGIGGGIGFVGSVMAQSLDGDVDVGQAFIDGGEGALAGAVVGSGAGLIAAAGGATAGGTMLAGGLAGGGAMAGEAAGQGVEIATGRRDEMSGEKIAVSGAVGFAAGATGPALEKSLSVLSAAATGPGGSGVTRAVQGVSDEAANGSLTKTVTATAETAVNAVTGYFNSFFSENDDSSQ